MVYPTLLPLKRTPRLPVVDWTDDAADLNGLVRFAERRNLVSARVPSHFRRSLQRLRVAIFTNGVKLWPPSTALIFALYYMQLQLAGQCLLLRHTVICLSHSTEMAPVNLLLLRSYIAATIVHVTLRNRAPGRRLYWYIIARLTDWLNECTELYVTVDKRKVFCRRYSCSWGGSNFWSWVFNGHSYNMKYKSSIFMQFHSLNFRFTITLFFWKQ